MSAAMNQEVIKMEEKICEIEATVVTGFEHMAKDEVKEKLEVESTSERGKINFCIPVKSVKKILELKSVDNLYIVMKHIGNFNFVQDTKEDIEKMIQVIPTLDWELGLYVWRKFFEFEHAISSAPVLGWENRFKETEIKHSSLALAEVKSDCEKKVESSPPPAKIAKHKELDPLLPSFRATCYRTGTNHAFQSPLAAHKFGGAIQDYFCWNVNLKNFDVEVVLSVVSDRGYIAIGLTKQSLHKRNITEFGITTLRPTIAYNMLRLSRIKDGDLVCDPMCGGGTIPIEAAVNWPLCRHICGDLDERSVLRCQANISNYNTKKATANKSTINVTPCFWDTTRLPLKDNSVDVFVSDMPFGKRSGTLMRNWHLYPKAVAEMARCAKLSTGRACLLTQDKKCFTKTLGMVKNYWSVGTVVGINIGGLAACAWLLNRTSKPYEGLTNQQVQEKKADVK